LEQCRSWLDHNLQGAKRTIVNGTGIAAKNVAELKDTSVAAIASKNALQVYGLKLLSEHVESPRDSFTKFWLISHRPAHPERHMEPKTSLCVSVRNHTGSLFKVLACFSMRDINVCKLESRPMTSSILHAYAPWEYLLYLDVDGAPEVDEALAHALANLREFATQVVILGSYPRFIIPQEKLLTTVGL